MTTPFDTTRLDEECERIARAWPPDAISPSWKVIRDIILDAPNARAMFPRSSLILFNLCRRPKMVPA